MTERIITDANGLKHITNEPLLHPPQRTWVRLMDEEAQELVQVSPLEFVMRVTNQEEIKGKPVFWAEWPTKEKNT